MASHVNIPRLTRYGLLSLILCFLTISLTAAVPQLINYQGRLTGPGGEAIDTVVSIMFTIYDHDGDAMWEEGHNGVTVTGGLFNILLGSNEAIPVDCFAGDTTRWLGIRIDDGDELEPRTRFVTVSYAYQALRADTANYALAAPGGGTDCGWTLTGNTTHLTDANDTVRVGNVDGNAKVNISEAILPGKDSASALGVWITDVNAVKATAGFFSAEGERGAATGLRVLGTSETTDTVYGVTTLATNLGTGPAVGVYGETEFEGNGTKIGVRGRGCGNGVGDVFGGHFETAGNPNGTGKKYGIFARANNITSTEAYGVYGEASNPLGGTVFGGRFVTSGVGSGRRYGVSAKAEANNNMQTYAVKGWASNEGLGAVYGGHFTALSPGSGSKRAIYGTSTTEGSEDAFGLHVNVIGRSSGVAHGLHAEASNTEDAGGVYGGLFGVTASGAEESYGIEVEGVSTGTGDLYGIHTSVTNTVGDAKGGIFTGRGSANVAGAAGNAWGDQADFSRGVSGYAENLGSGPAEAGYFSASNNGTGVHYGVYAYELAGGSGAAVYSVGDFVASGTKSAVMRTSEGTTLMYAMESSEVWFEEFGVGQMIGGSAHIELDPLFLETVTVDVDNPMKVFVQLNDDCNGTYVRTSTTGFDVRELMGGQSNASFTYRVVAKRRGYESERMRATEVGLDDPNLFPDRAEEIHQQMRPEGFSR